MVEKLKAWVKAHKTSLIVLAAIIVVALAVEPGSLIPAVIAFIIYKLGLLDKPINAIKDKFRGVGK